MIINKNFDQSFISGKYKLLAGVDEAGRGPLAGPVVAAAVIFAPGTFIKNVDDSKKLSEKERETLFPTIIEKSLAFSISAVSNFHIDRSNILQASLLAMKNAVNKLKVKPDLILIDGNKTFVHEIPTVTIVKGDSKSFCIAAASIIAKVARDSLMKRLCEKYPEYLWSKNKGYPTQQHIKAIKSFGPTILHRKSFLQNIIVDNCVPNSNGKKLVI